MAVFDVFAQMDTQTIVLLIVALAALGCVAGILAGLLGIGGGIVLVPGLLYIFQAMGMDSESLIHVCVGTSLALIIPNGLMSARSHWKKDAVDMSLVKLIGVGVLIGVAIGTVIADNLAGPTLQVVFACAVVVLAILMVADPSRFKLFSSMPKNPWPSVAGVGIGSLSSLIGIGGGTLSVPFMTLCTVPIHRAIGTASALGVVIAVPGTLGFILIGLEEAGRPPLSLGYVNTLAWLLILPTSLLSVKLGVWMAHKAPVKMMKRIFAVFLVIVAAKMWMDIL
jgi:uncharacterized membrane protein YfcA